MAGALSQPRLCLRLGMGLGHCLGLRLCLCGGAGAAGTGVGTGVGSGGNCGLISFCICLLFIGNLILGGLIISGGIGFDLSFCGIGITGCCGGFCMIGLLIIGVFIGF